MASNTTVAVTQKLRKKIKKLSALLDISQSVVIEQAVTCLENNLINNHGKLPSPIKPNDQSKSIESNVIDVSKILEEATKEMWNRDPERKELQQTLKSGPQTIDDFLFDRWITGLE